MNELIHSGYRSTSEIGSSFTDHIFNQYGYNNDYHSMTTRVYDLKTNEFLWEKIYFKGHFRFERSLKEYNQLQNQGR